MRKILYVFIGLDLLLANLLIVYLLGKQFAKDDVVESTQEQIPNNIESFKENIECPISCISLINNIQKKDDEDITEITPTSVPVITLVPFISAIKQKTRSTSYVPIPGSGSTLNTQWTDLTGTDFYLSTADYPGLMSVYFEANIRLQNGNGKAYVRLYDVTNSRGVDKSELTTDSQISVFVSDGPISLWSGNNHYRIQAKSLTADTTHFESGRLKIITEN